MGAVIEKAVFSNDSYGDKNSPVKYAANSGEDQTIPWILVRILRCVWDPGEDVQEVAGYEPVVRERDLY